jgi:ABC-type uncharacterized transport system ATPase subunit
MTQDSSDYRPPVLELEGITKRFPGIIANDHVNLTLRKGEILALLGENGAGKSTLMNVIYGLYHADEGTIRLHGEPTRFASPREAIRAGIGMVHQHFQLIPVMSVAENITLGEEKESVAGDDQKLIDQPAPRPHYADGARQVWGALWRGLTPFLGVALGLLAAQVVQQIVYLIGTYFAQGDQYRTFAFERLSLAAKGQQTLAEIYTRQPGLITGLVWLPLVVGMLAGGVSMWRLYLHAKRSWRGTNPNAHTPLDSVLEALLDFLGTVSVFLNKQKIALRVRSLSQRYGLEVDPDQMVGNLPVGLQQRVEIVKALYRKAEILILDEPTAVLTPQEADELFKVMHQLTERGVSIIFITHKLKEVLKIADTIVVMRGGKVVGTAIPNESTEATLASLMVGRDVILKVAKQASKVGITVLKVDGLHAYDDRGAHALQGVALEVRGGEVLGVAGVQGNGQTELVEVLTGLRKASAGSFRIAGQIFDHVTPRAITSVGTGHIPEDRQRYGMVSAFSVADNLVLNDYFEAPFAAPPSPSGLPVAVLIFLGVMLGVFAALAEVWAAFLYPALAGALGLTAPDLDPRENMGRFIVGLLLSIVAGVAFGVIAGVVANWVTQRFQLGDKAKGGITINRAAVDQNARDRVQKFDIRTPGIGVNAGNLSGGNQQKLVVAREFSRKPKLLIASQPTRGIDVGSIEFIHQQIIKQRDEGAAVLLVSAELDEIMALSDRIAVMVHGRIIQTLNAEDATREQLGLLMAGIREEVPA